MVHIDTDLGGFRFSSIQVDDHAGNLWITAMLTMAYACLMAIVRIKIEWTSLGWDDLTLLLSMPFLLGETGVIFSGLVQGLAKFNSITEEDRWIRAGQAFLTSEILAVIVLALAKLSTTTLILRVFTVVRGKICMSCLIIMFIVGPWGLCAVLGLAMHCSAAALLTTTNAVSSSHQYNRWRVITVVDVATDIVLSLLPGTLVSGLNMPRIMKIEVVFVFALRLPVTGLSILHLCSLKDYLDSQEPQFSVTNALIYQQGMLVWSLLSATIPQMRSFMKGFSIQMGLGIQNNATATGAYHAEQGIALRTIGRVSTRRVSARASRRLDDSESLQSFLRENSVSYEATISSTGSKNHNPRRQ